MQTLRATALLTMLLSIFFGGNFARAGCDAALNSVFGSTTPGDWVTFIYATNFHGTIRTSEQTVIGQVLEVGVARLKISIPGGYGAKSIPASEIKADSFVTLTSIDEAKILYEEEWPLAGYRAFDFDVAVYEAEVLGILKSIPEGQKIELIVDDPLDFYEPEVNGTRVVTGEIRSINETHMFFGVGSANGPMRDIRPGSIRILRD